MGKYEDMEYRQYTSRSEIEKALNTLKGILEGIIIDDETNYIELDELAAWSDTNNLFSNRKPFNELIPLINESISDNILTKDEITDILWVCNKFLKDNTYYDHITMTLQKLHGIFHGILADNIISENEIVKLKEWISTNDYLEGYYPYDEINTLLTSILSDGIITEDEINVLKVFFSEFVDNSIETNINFKDIEKLKEDYTISGVCSICPDITFENKTFCFTGASNKTTRDGFKNIITSLHGTFRNNISSKTDYLIIGNGGNPCWAYSCYGRKVEQALNLRKSGAKVIIIHENDFWDAIEDLA
ncbi:BRCT domain-containing protein [Clostridium paraputrificum]|uniref:BRCT domain-containing protein n=1 Tax=Clostridium paraputrificum TaxID=29363 RepID=UPI0034A1135D